MKSSHNPTKKSPLCTLSNRKGCEKGIMLMDGPACPSTTAQFSTFILFQHDWEVRTDSLDSLQPTPSHRNRLNIHPDSHPHLTPDEEARSILHSNKNLLICHLHS